MAVLGPCIIMNGQNLVNNQLTKSLERILEDACLCGELKLNNRKLKEFPKPTKYDLRDTVIADLSKNRFTDVPSELTTFLFLEKLLLSNNVLKKVPDAFGHLQSLTFLDLSSNQLTELPREICQMPLHVLLVSNNYLTSLPKEVGRISTLAELDASHNRLTQVPMTLGDCSSLRDLNLSNNQLCLLPLQVTYLQLENLDISCNCISSLPLELRNMSSLITLKIDNNPLVSPPITVCMRGRYHIFKYLENSANKESLPHKRLEDTRRAGKHSFLGTTAQGHQINSGNATIDCLRHRPRPVVDSGYCTDGVDKRWSNEAGDTNSGRSTPSTLSPGTSLSRTQSLSESPLLPVTPLLSGHRISPEGSMTNGDDKKLGHQLTYRQYKDAIRQQRQQDVYRPKTDSSPETDHSPNQSPIHNGINTPTHTSSPILSSTPRKHDQRPVQKVVPSRINKIYPTNGDVSPTQEAISDTYIKPTSPMKCTNGISEPKLVQVSYLKGTKPPAKMGWGKELVGDKLSFTMKREFDKQKEETELILQLRKIIESRLKMQLPQNLAPVLSDGVVLCHLVNHVRPRAVASVHVPSPVQPKLTMARCRKNVENFIEACKRIGVEEDAICAPDEVLQGDGDLSQLLTTVQALIALEKDIRYPNPYSSVSDLVTMREEDEFEQVHTEIKWKHEEIPSETKRNKVQFVEPFKMNGFASSERIDLDEIDSVNELEYDRAKMHLELRDNLNDQVQPVFVEHEHKNLITALCLGSFLLSFIILIIYPL